MQHLRKKTACRLRCCLGAIFSSGIVYISHTFLLSSIFDGHLLLVSAVPLRSFFYLLPSAKIAEQFADINSIPQAYGLLCQTLTSNPSFYESSDFFIKASDLSPSFGFKTPPALTFLSTPNWLFLIDERGHASSTLPDSVNIYIIYAKPKTGTEMHSPRSRCCCKKTSFSLPNTFQRLKSDKPQQTFIHISGFALSYRISQRWRYRMTFWRAFFYSDSL